MLNMLTQQASLEAREKILSLPFVPEVVQIISLNILPEIKSVLHMITNSYDFTSIFCQTASGAIEDGVRFVIPFI